MAKRIDELGIRRPYAPPCWYQVARCMFCVRATNFRNGRRGLPRETRARDRARQNVRERGERTDDQIAAPHRAREDSPTPSRMQPQRGGPEGDHDVVGAALRA